MSHSARYLLRKVPEITFLFWVVKCFTTAMGESFSDYLVVKISPYVAVGLGALALTIALVLQLKATKYTPWVYWLAVAMVAVFGTMAADVLHIQIGVPYALSSIFFSLVLATVFVIWYRTEKTLSIHSINSRRREYFYWLTVLTTFALGTAAGDWTAISLHLGYLASGVLFAAVMAVPIIGYLWLGFNRIAGFWAAYIITRPFGASFADWTGKAHRIGGLGWGDGTVSLLLTAFILVAVAYMSFNSRELRREYPETEF